MDEKALRVLEEIWDSQKEYLENQKTILGIYRKQMKRTMLALFVVFAIMIIIAIVK